ncbi:helix-turn-helix domain-containing protein [Cellulomonas sp. KRMCY2]|uniref:helix-turn-helix domain-containing protein n=1 Tax=Cellulomonas sp. KRMCY2 TaxID=1304865 RepID=UPI00045E9A02|nr:helix-turn-helix domain-containing protein [Cellulomonas sp. KRMCY2]
MSGQREQGDQRYLTSEFAPDWAVPPGRLIQRELSAAGFTQTDVAARTNISAKHLNQVLHGHVPLSPDVAVSLEMVLDVSADLWLRMDATWQAARLRRSSQESFADLAGWLNRFPGNVLESRNVLDGTAPVATRVEQLLRFFRVADVEAFQRVWLTPQASYRRSQKFAIDPYATALWLRLAEQAAEELAPDAAEYDAQRLREVARLIPGLSRLPVAQAFPQAVSLLLTSGVLLVFIPEVDNTRICGVSRWTHTGHPIIALSGRQKYLDILWFTLLHEVAHVILHPKRATYLEVDGSDTVVNDDRDALEAAADDFAQNAFLGPWERQLVRSLQDTDELVALAERAGVHPGIVAGRYGHDTGDWRKFGKLRPRIELATALIPT